MSEHQLWSVTNALFFIILIIIALYATMYFSSTLVNIRDIKKNWGKYRCSPTIMPFASFFGHNTADNFNFCMGKTFHIHASSYFGSFGTMLGSFTGLLHIIFNGISSIRNTIASLGGGIGVIFQEFTERISAFFFKLRLSAIRIKMLIGRMYAILFSVMYMGLSGITGLTTFTNTFLFGFLNTFCFPKDTLINVQSKGLVPISSIKIGDVLLPTQSTVTGTFRFFSKGQPMVSIHDVIVSTNHYVEYNGEYIMADKHPDAIKIGNWESDEPLYCLGTNDNKLPVKDLIFLDYDETDEGDISTMQMIEQRINAGKYSSSYNFTEYSPGIGEFTRIKMYNNEIKPANTIKIGDKLSTGNTVIGLIRKKIYEHSIIENNILCTPSLLKWNNIENKWIRVGTLGNIYKGTQEVVSFIVTPSSQIELENGTIIRDYMELCSPDSEMHYSNCLKTKKIVKNIG
jgi:hypothetical protein